MFPINPGIPSVKVSQKRFDSQEKAQGNRRFSKQGKSNYTFVFELRFQELLKKAQENSTAIIIPLRPNSLNVINGNEEKNLRYGRVCHECQIVYHKNSMRGCALVPYQAADEKVELLS